jgi:hypothetical protein
MCLNEGFFWMGRYIESGRPGLHLTRGTVVSERAWTRGIQAGTHRPTSSGSLVAGQETEEVGWRCAARMPGKGPVE